jgi:hypothetical protein
MNGHVLSARINKIRDIEVYRISVFPEAAKNEILRWMGNMRGNRANRK